jgi:protein TonB
MAVMRPTRRDRALAATGAAAAVAALTLALIYGLAGRGPGAAMPSLSLFPIAEEPPPPERSVPPRQRNRRPEGEAAPPNLRSTPTEIVAPPAIIPVPVPVIAAPVADVASAPTAGAADVPGPGTGAGGEGDGRGGGGSGDGDGGGYADGTPPRLVRGRLRDSDYPSAAIDAGASGTVGVRYLVGVDGRVSECSVTRSSGNALLDAVTCRLIRERFRFRPSRDGDGRAVPAYMVESHSWLMPGEAEG